MIRLCIVVAFILVTLPLAYTQSGGVEDTVRYHNRAKQSIESKTGTLKETAAGIEVTVSGKKLVISPSDIISVAYGKLAGVDDKIRQELVQIENHAADEVFAKYSEVLKAATTGGSDDKSKRFLEFKLAMAGARLADTKVGDEFKTEAKAAIDRLITVARSYNKSWEVWPATRTCARLQAELGKYNEAASTLATLAKVDGLPVELRNEAKIAEAEVLFRSGAAISAEPAVDALGKVSGLTGAQKERLAVLQAVMQGAKSRTDAMKVAAAAISVQGLIDRMSDPVAKAAAHNLLGELYLMAKTPQEAKWQFLWVEAVYNQDRDEVVKALHRLSELFDAQDKKEMADTYREKLLKLKSST